MVKYKRVTEIMNFDRLERYFLRSPRFLVIVMLLLPRSLQPVIAGHDNIYYILTLFPLL
jgi:hypothetical protein